MTEPTIREAIESALGGDSQPSPTAPAESSSAATAPPAPAPAQQSAPQPQAPAQDARSGDSAPSGQSAGARGDSQRDLFAKPESPFAPRDKTATPAPPPSAAHQAPLQELKAPASWKADLRQHWKAISPEVQQEIHRREREVDVRMQENAQLRRFAQKFNDIAEPYRAIMQAEGADPFTAFADYLKSAQLLRNGAPMDKARMVAQLIQHFGVPVQALDQYLEQAIRGGATWNQQGQVGATSSNAVQQPQQFRDPRVDQLLANMEARERAGVAHEANAFAADPKHEFFDDVRLTMADVMDAAAKRGVQLSLEDAYERACQIEPEVRKVLQQRAATGNASQAARTLAAARHAASSLPSQSAAPAPKTNGQSAPGTVREAILASIDSLSSAQ